MTQRPGTEPKQSPFTFENPFQALYIGAFSRSPEEATCIAAFFGDALLKRDNVDGPNLVAEIIEQVHRIFFITVLRDNATKLWAWRDERPTVFAFRTGSSPDDDLIPSVRGPISHDLH